MKRRHVPNTVSKRFRRKLARSRNPYQLWLRCKRPHVWSRLVRYWRYRWIETITDIEPFKTPLFSTMPKVSSGHLRADWITDDLHA